MTRFGVKYGPHPTRRLGTTAPYQLALVRRQPVDAARPACCSLVGGWSRDRHPANRRSRAGAPDDGLLPRLVSLLLWRRCLRFHAVFSPFTPVIFSQKIGFPHSPTRQPMTSTPDCFNSRFLDGDSSSWTTMAAQLLQARENGGRRPGFPSFSPISSPMNAYQRQPANAQASHPSYHADLTSLWRLLRKLWTIKADCLPSARQATVGHFSLETVQFPIQLFRIIDRESSHVKPVTLATFSHFQHRNRSSWRREMRIKGSTKGKSKWRPWPFRSRGSPRFIPPLCKWSRISFNHREWTGNSTHQPSWPSTNQRSINWRFIVSTVPNHGQNEEETGPDGITNHWLDGTNWNDIIHPNDPSIFKRRRKLPQLQLNYANSSTVSIQSAVIRIHGARISPLIALSITFSPVTAHYRHFHQFQIFLMSF